MDMKILIKKIRGEKTVREFAKEIGVSYMTVYNWESGDSMPTIKRMEQLGIECVYKRKKTA